MYKNANIPLKNTFFIFPNISCSFFCFFINCRVSGARYPTDPAIAKTSRSTIANHTQRHIRQPLQGEHCRSQRFYRHSVFIWCLTTTVSDSPDLPLFRLSSLIHPHMYSWWRCRVPPPGPKRLFRNGFRIIIAFAIGNIINIRTGKCKFLSYNDRKRHIL